MYTHTHARPCTRVCMCAHSRAQALAWYERALLIKMRCRGEDDAAVADVLLGMALTREDQVSHPLPHPSTDACTHAHMYTSIHVRAYACTQARARMHAWQCLHSPDQAMPAEALQLYNRALPALVVRHGAKSLDVLEIYAKITQMKRLVGAAGAAATDAK